MPLWQWQRCCLLFVVWMMTEALVSQAAVQEQANKLFATSSEANSVLCDPVRRSEVCLKHRTCTCMMSVPVFNSSRGAQSQRKA